MNVYNIKICNILNPKLPNMKVFSSGIDKQHAYSRQESA